MNSRRSDHHKLRSETFALHQGFRIPCDDQFLIRGDHPHLDFGALRAELSQLAPNVVALGIDLLDAELELLALEMGNVLDRTYIYERAREECADAGDESDISKVLRPLP